MSGAGRLAPHAFVVILSMGCVSLGLGEAIERHWGSLVWLFSAPLKSSVRLEENLAFLESHGYQMVNVSPGPEIPRLSLLRSIWGCLLYTSDAADEVCRV